jgi:hypothetical protein
MSRFKSFFIYVVLLVLALFMFKGQEDLKHFPDDKPFQFDQDINQYYSYLTAAFIEGDLSFDYPNNFWLIDVNGNEVQRVTMGMAYLYSPFFTIGHVIALNSSEYEANGYSLPYSTAVHTGTLIYVLIGLLFTMLILSRFFNKTITVITTLVVFFGTNLFYYTMGTGETSHSYLYAINAVLIYLMIRWFDNNKPKYIYWFSLLFGLSVLIRPTQVLFLIIPLIYGITSFSDIGERFRLLYGHKKAIGIGILLFLLPMIPQFIYWKVYAGQWILYSYGDEGFFFSNPHILDYLFSYRKGWFVYTPLMLFAFVGMFVFPQKLKSFRWGVPIFIILIIYIQASWWCWWYGGSFGMRTMIEFYPLLAIPFAALLERTYRKIPLLLSSFVLLLTLTAFNLFNIYQYYNWAIHWDAMSKKSYWTSFLEVKMDLKEQKVYKNALIKPDYEGARKDGKEKFDQ